MYSIFDNDKKHLCSYEGNKVYDSYNDFLKREIGSFDMEGNVYRNNTLIGKVDTDGYMYLKGERIGRCENGIITNGAWFTDSYNPREGDMGYYEGYDVFGAAAAALVVIEHLQNNQIKTTYTSYSKEITIDKVEKKQEYVENNSSGNELIDRLASEFLLGAWIDLKPKRIQKGPLIDVLMWLLFIIENLLIGATFINIFADAPKGVIIFSCIIVSVSMFNFIKKKNRATILEIITTFFCGIICDVIRLAGVVSEIYGLYYLYIFFMYLMGHK